MLPSPPTVAISEVASNIQHHQDVHDNTQDYSTDHRGTVSSQNTNLTTDQCTYKHGGYCSSHQKQAERGLQVTRKWGLLKTGLHGYVTRRKVTWTCKVQQLSGDETTNSTARDDISSQQTVATGGSN